MSNAQPPILDSEQAYMESMYSEDERRKILEEIDQVANASRLSSTDYEAYKPRKRGIFFPVLINVLALLLIAGGWFAADAWFKSRQQTLSLKTNQLFSAEGTLLAKVMEESQAKLAEKNQEIRSIQDNLARLAQEKEHLTLTMKAQVDERTKKLKAELEQQIEAERQKLLAEGLSPAVVEQRLKALEAQKNAEFERQLQQFRQQAQEQIDQRSRELKALQDQLNSAQSNASTQTRQAEVVAKRLAVLQRERDELDLLFRQSSALYKELHRAFLEGHLITAQTALNNLKELYRQAEQADLTAVQQRAQTGLVVTASLQIALNAMKNGGKDPRFEAFLQGMKQADQAKADQRAALAALAVSRVPEIEHAFQLLREEQTRREQAQIEALLAQAKALAVKKGPAAELELLHSGVSSVALKDGINAAWKAYQDEIAKDEAQLAKIKNLTGDQSGKTAELEKQVASLLPYQTKWNTLAALYHKYQDSAFSALKAPGAPRFDDATKDFLQTFATEDAQTLFPNFDSALAIYNAGTKPYDPNKVRHQAFDDVLSFTSYLQGNNSDAKAAQDKANSLSQDDTKYREVLMAIQNLLSKGAIEAKIDTSTLRFVGSIVNLDGNTAVIEPLTRVQAQVGQMIEIHHRRGTADDLVARGRVTQASPSMVVVSVQPVEGAAFTPTSGDGAYLVVQ